MPSDVMTGLGVLGKSRDQWERGPEEGHVCGREGRRKNSFNENSIEADILLGGTGTHARHEGAYLVRQGLTRYV